MRSLALLLLTAACSSVRPAWSIEKALDETRRTTTEGDVIGGAATHGGFAWLGIPFAAPPVGPLRWKPPQAPKHRDAPLTATHFAHACAQVRNFLTINEPAHDGIFGDEDCLYLNVWAPPQAKGLPVMMWIHGGGNSIGSAAGFDLSNLAMKENVVAVSVQYRLGPLGWLRHSALAGDDDASGGNYGTLDLVRALEWLRDNAQAFGGDANNVTVFGESAGGTNTYSMLLSPKAKGLFHRAVAQSPFVSRTTHAQAEHDHPNSSGQVLERLLMKRGVKGRDEAKARLKAMSPQEIASTLRALPPAELIALYVEGAPLIGGQLDLPMLFHDGAVLPESTWFEAFAKADGWNRVPVITGSNKDEAKLFQFLDPRWVYMLFGLLPRIRDEAKYNATASQITRLWRGFCVDAIAQAMRGSGASDVWSYRFDWDHEPTLLGTDLAKLLGAAHGLEIPFVHGDFEGQNGQLMGGANNPERDALSKVMMDHWGAFARDGKPGATWQTYEPGPPPALKYLTFDTPLERVKMAGDIEDPEAVLTELLADPNVEQQQKCSGLTKLVDMGFVDAERAAKVPECKP